MGCSLCSVDRPELGLDSLSAMAKQKPRKVMAQEEELDQKGKPQMNELSRYLTERNPKYVFSITFESRPLGIILTSNADGTCAYVTVVDGSKNSAVEDNNLPLNSKLLACNGIDIESDTIRDIEKRIKAGQEGLPLTLNEKKIEAGKGSPPLRLTFCHPDGLYEGEFPDLAATE